MEKLELETSEKKKIIKSIAANARTFIGTFIIFAIIVVMTTDIRLITASDLSALGVNFFLLLVCTFSFYSLCNDAGVKYGLIAQVFINAKKRFQDLKNKILDGLRYTRLNEFCVQYVSEDLKNTRLQYLSVAGISYDTYLDQYSKMTDEDIDKLEGFSNLQRHAIKKANNVRPIKLTPKMLMQNGSDTHSRSPLPMSPKTKRRLTFGFTATKLLIFSLTFTVISFEVVSNPSWAMFVAVCAKLMSVLINGYGGYKDGYNNIAVDTTEYFDCQSDLIEQAIHYIDTLPPLKKPPVHVQTLVDNSINEDISLKDKL